MGDVGSAGRGAGVRLLTRPYEPADARAVVELTNLADRAGGGSGGMTADEMASFMRLRVADPRSDSRLWFAADGALVANGAVPTPASDGELLVLYGDVHPAWRGRGIGRELLGWQLDRAARITAAVAPEAAWQVCVSAAAGDDATERLLRRHEFAPVRYWHEMAVQLGVRERPWLASAEVPAGVRLAEYSAEHERALYETQNAAFADHWGYVRRPFETWVESMRSTPFLPAVSLLAFDGSVVVGYVLCTGTAESGVGHVWGVGVLPRWRRHGLASAMLARSLGAMAAAGYTSAILGVDADNPTGATGLYERLGFAVRHSVVSYAAHLDDLPAVGDS